MFFGVVVIFMPDENLFTGISEIDEQHNKLFKTLHSLKNDDIDYDKMIKILVDLRNYVLEHFATEELYMQKFEYSNYVEHKILHNKFTDDYNNLLVDLAGGLLLSTVPSSLMELLNTWLMTHYQDADIKLAEFLKKRLDTLSQE